MQNERKKILWLVSWYPNKYDLFDGDFIQRHARAAALYDDIHVLFVKLAEGQKEVEKFCHETDGLTEQIIYLPKRNGLWAKLMNFLRWRQAYQQEVALFIQRHPPAVIHVHVPWKAGLMALWAKKKYRIPFLVTEHWGIYNDVVADNIHTRSFFFRAFLKRIYSRAKTVVSVSRFLGRGIGAHLLQRRFTVIPNVVDTALFFPVVETKAPFTFLHVSNMVPLKNVEGILLAFQSFLQQTGAQAQLVMVGNKDDQYVQLARTISLLSDTVFFKGEISYSEVAGYMQQAHVSVLNSDMENSPCVIGEALCCGLPVIATNVGGIPELVSAENGILVPARNTAALAAAFYQVWKEYDRFNRRAIASTAQKIFGMEVVGAQLHQLYA
jgi:glycosyltransferase involved in cell wall biosynthesis